MILHWSMITHDRNYKLHVHVWYTWFLLPQLCLPQSVRGCACVLRGRQKVEATRLIAQNFVIMLAVIGSLLFASVAVSTGEPLHVGYIDIHDASDSHRTAV